MTTSQQAAAKTALHGAHSGTLTFPQIVASLMTDGFDGYAVDLRQAITTYYLPDGASLVLQGPKPRGPVAGSWDLAAIRDAIRAAQTHAAGYTYAGFCDRVAEAGCAGYVVSFTGRRVLYYGRTGDAHTEHFPADPAR